MPEFLEDPSVLTKDRLKSELLANNVTLPAGEQRKDVYVQLYLQHLTARNRPPPPPPAQPRPPAPAANSRAPPDFSSDDEREPTPVLSAAGRGRGGGGAAAGRKATKKTDKPRSEEKDDFDVTELTNEELLSQLVKYGVNPGPIVGTTRKLYEKKLLKLREHGQESRSSTPLPAVSSSSENARQNGNDDSDRYSDNEEELKLEKREPLKGKTKAPVTLKQRRVEHNQSYSQTGLTETLWTSGSSKSGRLQGLTREPTRGSRRTPRKRVETAEQLRVDGEVISESLPIAETIMASSNETLVVNRVTGNFKHAAPILPISEFSDIPRRTPKKPLTRAEVGELTLTEDRRIERDILKEMFPFEAATPTGISASCRRPIKGAAGRPLELGDFRMEGTFSSKYVPKYAPLADDKTERKGRSVPMWIKILLFVIVAVFLFLVYQAMETNQGNPFSHFLSNESPNTFQAKAN